MVQLDILRTRSELRKDPIVARWVIIAANRAARPHAFIAPDQREPDGPCPFCEGRESDTPGEVLAFRSPGGEANGPGWRVRVVPNKFPALGMNGVGQNSPPLPTNLRSVPGEGGGEGESARGSRVQSVQSVQRPLTPAHSGHRPKVGRERGTELDFGPDFDPGGGMYGHMPGVGAHEVIIESPRHLVSTSELSEEELGEVFLAYRQRLAQLKQDPRLAQAIIFKNVGQAAGASIEHTHSQLVATPIVPPAIREELQGGLEFFRTQGRCVWCEMLRQEREDGRRMVLETDGVSAFCPFAARLPYETWIVPKVHASHYESVEEQAAREVAVAMKRVMAKIDAALARPAYNYVIHSAPFDMEAAEHYHWHIEVIPILARTAGFEWGSGCFMNPVPPEDAAAVLRNP
jgi:UDPglucose--hexose-1-phosphate uridylyltransferase